MGCRVVGVGHTNQRPPPPARRGWGGSMGFVLKSHRLALVLALLAALDGAVAEHGWHGTHRLRAFVARVVSDLLAA